MQSACQEPLPQEQVPRIPVSPQVSTQTQQAALSSNGEPGQLGPEVQTVNMWCFKLKPLGALRGDL